MSNDTFDRGLAWGEDRATSNAAGKKALSDAELETHLETYGHAIDGLTTKLGTFEPGTKEHEETQQQLATALRERTGLLHPDNNPNALQRIGKHIAEKLHLVHPDLPDAVRISQQPVAATPGTASQTLPGMTPGDAPMVTQAIPAEPATTQARLAPSTNPAVLKAQAEANLISSSQPAYQKPLLTSEEQGKAARIHAGLEAKEVQVPDKPLSQKLITLVDGAGNRHLGYMQNGEFKVAGGTEGLSTPVPGPKVGSFGDLMMAAYGPHPTAKQYKEGRRYWLNAGAGTTVGSHEILVPQPDGSIKTITVETSSRKQFGNEPEPPSTRQDQPNPASAPSTPGSLRSQIKKPTTTTRGPSPQAPKANGRVVGGKQLPQATKALEAVDTAEGAYRDVERASQDPTPLGDKGIVLAWLRGRVNRVTATEIQSVSSLGGAKFAVENGEARILEGKMSDAQREWFKRSSKENYENAKAVAAKYSGAPSTSNIGGDDTSQAKHKIRIGNKFYTYNGSGDTADLKNYTEAP